MYLRYSKENKQLDFHVDRPRWRGFSLVDKFHTPPRAAFDQNRSSSYSPFPNQHPISFSTNILEPKIIANCNHLSRNCDDAGPTWMLSSSLLQALPFPSPQFSSTLLIKALKPSLFPPFLSMKDRPPSSYGAVYVPPHHRLRSVITSPNHTSAALIDSKLREAQSAVLNPRAGTLPHFQAQNNQQQEQLHKGNSQYNSACDDRVSEEDSDREFESFSQPVRLLFHSIIFIFFGVIFSFDFDWMSYCLFENFHLLSCPIFILQWWALP